MALKDMCCGTVGPTVVEASTSSAGRYLCSVPREEAAVNRLGGRSRLTLEVCEDPVGVFMAKLLGKIMDRRNPRELCGFWSMNIR